MRGSGAALLVVAAALCLACSRADAQGAVISGDVSGSKALDETNFNFDNSGLGDLSTEGEVSAAPPQDSGSSAESRGADSLGAVVQLPAPPTGLPPPVPPPAPPYLAGLGGYGDVTAADVGAYPGVLNIAARAAALALPQVLAMVNPGGASGNTTMAAANGTALGPDASTPSSQETTAAGAEGSVSSPVNEPSSDADTRPGFPSGRATGAGTTEPSEGTTTVQLGVSSGGSGNAAGRRSSAQAAVTVGAAAAAAALLLSAL